MMVGFTLHTLPMLLIKINLIISNNLSACGPLTYDYEMARCSKQKPCPKGYKKCSAIKYTKECRSSELYKRGVCCYKKKDGKRHPCDRAKTHYNVARS